MNFLILNRSMAEIYSYEEPHIYISITDPESRFPVLKDNPNRLKTLWIKFDDVDDKINTVNGKRLPKLFEVDHAEIILNFVEKFKNDVGTIITQCDGGISRSSATAGALSVIYNGSKSDNWIFKSRQYYPNMLVYRTLLDTYFNNYT